MSLTLSPIDAVLRGAKMLDPVREVPENRGTFVDAINTFCGSPLGSSWCLNFVQYVGKQMLRADWPLTVQGSCDVLLKEASAKGIIRDTPMPGDIFLRINPANPKDATHAGFVDFLLRTPHKFSSIEGNSNDTGSREGTDVVTLVRSTDGLVFLRWELLLRFEPGAHQSTGEWKGTQ